MMTRSLRDEPCRCQRLGHATHLERYRDRATKVAVSISLALLDAEQWKRGYTGNWELNGQAR